MRVAGLAEQIERLVPGDVAVLQTNRMRLTMFLNEEGGILDDLMITRLANKDGFERLFLVVNAACKDADFAHIQTSLPGVKLTRWEDRALVALQGPNAAEILARHFSGVDVMPFMSMLPFPGDGGEIFVSRSGYTGEDGYEISIPANDSAAFCW